MWWLPLLLDVFDDGDVGVDRGGAPAVGQGLVDFAKGAFAQGVEGAARRFAAVGDPEDIDDFAAVGVW